MSNRKISERRKDGKIFPFSKSFLKKWKDLSDFPGKISAQILQFSRTATNSSADFPNIHYPRCGPLLSSISPIDTIYVMTHQNYGFIEIGIELK